jgi:hypothetical protein
MPMGLLDPESERIAEAYAALPSVKKQTRGLLSLEPQPEQSTAQTAFEMLASFIPGVGQALAARDIERARRANDPAAAAMAATEFLPFGRLAGLGKKAGPVMSEIDVYHGSPHRFEKFDASKIGTGEGAQAYGHGIYLAESPNVAQHYATGGGGFVPVQGKDNVYFNGQWVQDFSDKKSPEGLAKYAMSQSSTGTTIQEKIETLNKIGRKDAADWLEKNADKFNQSKGNLYTADLPDEMVDRMLDWDKPLSEQSETVKKALLANPNIAAEVQRLNEQRIALNKQSPGRLTHPVIGKLANKETTPESLKGEAIYTLLAKDGDRVKVSEYLRSLGIPGIRYLDAGSRSQGGTGTRNFVVFPGEEKKVKIKKRE